MKAVLGILVALMVSTCVAAPALACSGYPMAVVEAERAKHGLTWDDLGDVARKEVTDWYNKQPPESDIQYDRVAFLRGPGVSFLIFVKDDCAVFIERMTPEKLMLLMGQRNI